MPATTPKWKPLFTREYPLYIIDMAARAYGKKMKEALGWGYRAALFISEKGLETSYYSARDAFSFIKFYKKIDVSRVMRLNEAIRFHHRN